MGARRYVLCPVRLLAPIVACALLAGVSPSAVAQWDPLAGDWSPAGARDLRVMTWNVADGICSTADKSGSDDNWTALARIVAAMQPDVLLLQETGDNSGNGTGSGVDSVADLELTLHLFVEGGRDSFHAGAPPVGASVRAFAPQVELPYVAVSFSTDGYNRNALLSRYPFADINGDGAAVASDMPTITPHLWSPGGKGGIRGWQMVEIDLPDATYAGDALVGNSHLKAGTSASDHDKRVDAAKNISYLIEHLLNGAGTALPDPWNTIADDPPVSMVLDPASLVITGGDWNEDESANGSVKGPAAWIVQAQSPDEAGGGDGSDKDGSDMRFDAAQDVFTGGTTTLGPLKRDYIAWQDAVGTLRQAFVFETGNLPDDGLATPSVLLGVPDVTALSAHASDHRPVIADLVLPSIPCNDATDLGYGMAAAREAVPYFAVCTHGPVGTQVWTLIDAPPGSVAVPIAGAASVAQQAFGGTLLPSPPRVLPPLHVDDTGALELHVPRQQPGLAKLGGQVVQWVLVDPARHEVVALSNGVLLPSRRP